MHWLTANWGEPFLSEGRYLSSADIHQYGIDTYIRELAENHECMATVIRYIPEYGDPVFVKERLNDTLRFSNVWFPKPITPDVLAKQDEELKIIPVR